MHTSQDAVRDRFGFLFVTLGRHWRRVVDQQLAASGLTDATWTPLMHLDQSGDGIPQTELARRLDLDTSTLVRLLDLLEERNLVERRVDPADRRARLIHVTNSGRKRITEIRAKLKEIEAELLADINDTGLKQITDAFGSIESRIENLLARETPR